MRTAVIGVGAIARHHLAALRETPEAVLVGVCDLSPAAAEAAAERYGAAGWYTDHATMLAEARPEIVHVTTSPESHFTIAADCLDAGAHVIVEKPAATSHADVVALLDRAHAAGRMLVEDYNYLFNPPVVELLGLVGSLGKDGVVHVEVGLTLDLLGAGSPFSDPGYASHRLPGGAVTDFLPHLASLAHGLVGRHRRVATIRSKRQAASHLHSDEFRALVDAEGGTAALLFSANSRPDAMWVHVETAAFRATAGIFEPRLVVTRSRPSAGPFQGVAGGVAEAATIGRAAIGGLFGKVSGRAGSLDGLAELVIRTHRAAATGSDPPVSPRQIDEVNALVAALVDESNQL
ncbi:MAG: hypothetical protein JWP02_3959 [Acidimicrobiales bacterium]|nr:hypothetical protein [Acidimicrobiales bacterium]